MAFLLAIDGEFSGDVLGQHSMTCLGAAVVDVRARKVVDTFLVFLDPTDQIWEKRCLEEFWLTEENRPWFDELRQRQRTEGVPLAEAAVLFTGWARKMADACKGDIVVVSDTCGNDIAWVNHMLGQGWADGKGDFAPHRIPDSDEPCLIDDRPDDGLVAPSVKYLFGGYKAPRETSGAG